MSRSPTAFADVIPGTAETVRELRAHGLRIGSTTGYTHDIMAEILPVAAAQGFAPDSLVCTGDTTEGRPSPLMMYKSFVDLGVYPASSVVKVDATEVGIAEGINAGCWTVGVAVSGNLFGLSLEDTQRLPSAEFAARRERAAARLSVAARTPSSTASPTSFRSSVNLMRSWRSAQTPGSRNSPRAECRRKRAHLSLQP